MPARWRRHRRLASTVGALGTLGLAGLLVMLTLSAGGIDGCRAPDREHDHDDRSHGPRPAEDRPGALTSGRAQPAASGGSA